MSEDEFWGSTAAKVFALSEKRDFYDERRDFYPAFLSALLFNVNKGRGDKAMKAEDLIRAHYPERKSVMITHNPDLGAITDANLTAMFEFKGKRRKKKNGKRT